MTPEKLSSALTETFADQLESVNVDFNEVTIEVTPANLIELLDR